MHGFLIRATQYKTLITKNGFIEEKLPSRANKYDKYMKRYSTSLVITEMCIKTMRYHFSGEIFGEILKILVISSTDKDMWE